MTNSNGTPAYPESWVLEPYKAAPQLLKLEHRNQKTGKVTTSDYLPVKGRLVWFVTEQRQLIAAGLATTTYFIRPRLIEHDPQNGTAVFECSIRDVLGNETTDYGSESRADWRDYLEKAATKATGRALAALGYGTSFAPELDEEDRIADSPREQPRPQSSPKPEQKESSSDSSTDEPANEQQLSSIRKLCAALGREEPDPVMLSFTKASALLRDLSKEFNARRRAS